MSWVQSKSAVLRAGLAAALVCGVVGAAPVAAEDALIVKSTVAKYRVGSKLDDKDEITLTAGDVVTVLTKKGTRTMKGPGTFVVGAQPKRNRARFASFTRKGAAERVGTGGVRGAANDVDRPRVSNLYFIDVDRSGSVCLRDLETVTLWRPYAVEAATYTLSEAAGETPDQLLSLSIPFAKRAAEANVDAARFQLSAGTSYTIQGPDTAELSTITIVDLGADIRAPEQLAEALLANGCQTQFEALTDLLAPEG